MKRKEGYALSVAIGCDNAGFDMKEAIISLLMKKNIPFDDFGVSSKNTEDPVPYPAIGSGVAHDVASGNHEFGILICGTGIGMSMAANKLRGARAALVTNLYSAEMARRHNNANIMCLGGRVTSIEDALKFCEVFLSTGFDSGRHADRVSMIDTFI